MPNLIKDCRHLSAVCRTCSQSSSCPTLDQESRRNAPV